MNTRMRLTAATDDRATIAYTDEDGLRVERRFYARPGQYITEVLDNGGTTQPCERLSNRGATLIRGQRETVADVIRREWKRRQRALRKERSEW